MNESIAVLGALPEGIEIDGATIITRAEKVEDLEKFDAVVSFNPYESLGVILYLASKGIEIILCHDREPQYETELLINGARSISGFHNFCLNSGIAKKLMLSQKTVDECMFSGNCLAGYIRAFFKINPKEPSQEVKNTDGTNFHKLQKLLFPV